MHSKSLKDKLIRVERTINIYKRDNELISEINIDIPIEKLKQIVAPNEDDPELYDGYKLKEEQLQALNEYLENKIEPQFEIYSYFLVAGGIYDWGNVPN